jgi:hypothetical protein
MRKKNSPELIWIELSASSGSALRPTIALPPFASSQRQPLPSIWYLGTFGMSSPELTLAPETSSYLEPHLINSYGDALDDCAAKLASRS